MVVEEEDLGLSLSLSFPVHGNDRGRVVGLGGGRVRRHLLQQQIPARHLSRSFVPYNGSTASLGLLTHHSTPQNVAFPPVERNPELIHVEPQPLLRGIDVNRIPCMTEDGEDELGISSPNSTVSSISGDKRGERYVTLNGEDHDFERACSQGMSDEDDGGGDASRKKLRLSKDQAAILEETFREHCTLNPKQKVALAKQLGLRTRQVEVWFQNRRARLEKVIYLCFYYMSWILDNDSWTKLKQTEVDCEFLRRCCENLTNENRRLQKEVQELRVLKLSPQFYMPMTPPTTLTMCPSCDRVGLPSSSAPSLHRPISSNLST